MKDIAAAVCMICVIAKDHKQLESESLLLIVRIKVDMFVRYALSDSFPTAPQKTNKAKRQRWKGLELLMYI